MKPINHLSIFNALEYIMVMKATLLAWWKINPTLQPQTKSTHSDGCEGKR